MKDYFIDLFRYTDWADRRVFVALPDIIDSEPRALVLFTHLVLVQRLWLARIRQTGEKFALWEPVPLPQLIRIANESSEEWLEYLQCAPENEFDRVVSYVNTQGVAYQNTVAQIATQTINHSTHHRGQIIALIRRQGYEPPLTDYIAYARHEA